MALFFLMNFAYNYIYCLVPLPPLAAYSNEYESTHYYSALSTSLIGSDMGKQ
jgi:hypothetical protein